MSASGTPNCSATIFLTRCSMLSIHSLRGLLKRITGFYQFVS
jgi:hypothetical protein